MGSTGWRSVSDWKMLPFPFQRMWGLFQPQEVLPQRAGTLLPAQLAFPHLRGSPRVEQSPLDRTKASIWLTEAALNLQGFDPKHGLLSTWSGRGRMNESPAFCSRATPDQRGRHLCWLSTSLHLPLPAPLQGLPEVGGKARCCTLGHSGE